MLMFGDKTRGLAPRSIDPLLMSAAVSSERPDSEWTEPSFRDPLEPRSVRAAAKAAASNWK